MKTKKLGITYDKLLPCMSQLYGLIRTNQRTIIYSYFWQQKVDSEFKKSLTHHQKWQSAFSKSNSKKSFPPQAAKVSWRTISMKMFLRPRNNEARPLADTWANCLVHQRFSCCSQRKNLIDKSFLPHDQKTSRAVWHLEPTLCKVQWWF